jgi:hypothetical protein
MPKVRPRRCHRPWDRLSHIASTLTAGPAHSGGTPFGPVHPNAEQKVAAATAAASAPPFSAPYSAPSSVQFELLEATVASIQAALLGRVLTCRMLVEMYLQRICAYNGQSCHYPHGLLGADVETVAQSGRVNALSTVNLRPAARKAWVRWYWAAASAIVWRGNAVD